MLATRNYGTNISDGCRTAFTNIDGKFKNGALRDFLLKPWAHDTWGRMPDFGLSQEEATQLAVFLRSLKKGGPTKVLLGNVKKGEMLVLSLGCLNCHKNPIKEFYQAPSMSSIAKAGDKGCLSEFPKTAPNFYFTTEQRAALKIFLGKGTQSLKRRSLAEFAERQVIALNCRACHPMDGAQNRLSHLPGLTSHLSVEVGDVDAEAAGRKKDPPDLTHVGEMLQTDWMARLFTGKLNYKPRPWMKMRMPAFPARGEHLAHGLAQKHGMPSGVKQPTFEASQTSVGQKLVSTNGGFGCVACHAVGDKPALAPFEGQGLNFTYSRERLNHEFYMRWMLNPQRLNPFSIMPRYADDEGQTALADALAGDAHDQFNAIWQYLANGDL